MEWSGVQRNNTGYSRARRRGVSTPTALVARVFAEEAVERKNSLSPVCAESSVSVFRFWVSFDGGPIAYALNTPQPQGGRTVSCGVFRAPREYEGGACSEMQRKTTEYNGIRVLSETRNTHSASSAQSPCGSYPRDMGRYGGRYGEMFRF